MATINAARDAIARNPGNYRRFENYDARRPAKRAWGEVLEQFLRSKGGMTWNPVVAGKELDLYVLYHEVCKQGGVEAVVKGKRWKRVTVALELPPTCTNAAYTLRKNYYRWLYAFECHDVHGITLSNDEVERLAQGVEPSDSEDVAALLPESSASRSDPTYGKVTPAGPELAPAKHDVGASAVVGHIAPILGTKKLLEAVSLSTGSHTGSGAMAMGSSGGAEDNAAAPGLKTADGAGGMGNLPACIGGFQGARGVPNTTVPVLPQQPKRNIAMLPLHPPISGMGGQVTGLPGLNAPGGVWHNAGVPNLILFSQLPVQSQAWPSAEGNSSNSDRVAVSQIVGPTTGAGPSFSNNGGVRKRDSDEFCADEAKRPKNLAYDGGVSGAGTAGGGTVWGTSRNPVYMQQMEDEKLAAGLVQAAGSRAVMSQGMGQPAPSSGTVASSLAAMANGAAMNVRELAILADCREHVRQHGGPDIEALGWVCRIGAAEGDGRMVEANFISPQGFRLRTVAHVIKFFEAAGGLKGASANDAQGLLQQIQGIGNGSSTEILSSMRREDKTVAEGQKAHPEKMKSGEGEGEAVHLDEDMLSSVKFPLSLLNGELVVETLGEIISNHPLYHDSQFIYPVGYRAKRTCNPAPGQTKPQTYFCEVMHCGKQPLFRITPLDRSEGKHRTAANNPNLALQELSPRLSKVWGGAAFFGLEKTEVRALIERLPGANRCSAYKRWALGTPPPTTGPTQLANFSVRLRRDLANTPMLECMKMVNEIMAHRCAWPFLEPVKNAHRGLEDYGSRIRRPMDLGTVFEKLKDDQYRNPHLCRVDVIQVWRNCLYYSGDKDDATFMAREVGEEFDALFADRILAPVLQQSRRAATTPQAIIGQSVLVFDSVEFVWRDARILEYDAAAQMHKLVVYDDLDPKEHKAHSRIAAAAAPASENETESDDVFNPKTACRMPDLLPPSMMMRITRREQERQRRRNVKKLQAAGVLSGYIPQTTPPNDWDTRWIKLPCVDVVLCTSPDLDGTRWDGEWPGKIDATHPVWPPTSTMGVSSSLGTSASAEPASGESRDGAGAAERTSEPLAEADVAS